VGGDGVFLRVNGSFGDAIGEEAFLPLALNFAQKFAEDVNSSFLKFLQERRLPTGQKGAFVNGVPVSAEHSVNENAIRRPGIGKAKIKVILGGKLSHQIRAENIVAQRKMLLFLALLKMGEGKGEFLHEQFSFSGGVASIISAAPRLVKGKSAIACLFNRNGNGHTDHGVDKKQNACGSNGEKIRFGLNFFQ
jgi:hypothetical protein